MDKQQDTNLEDNVEEIVEVETIEEGTTAADSLKPNSKPISDPKTKIGIIQSVLGQMSAMSKDDLNGWYKTISQYGPGKDYGVGDNSGKNASTIDSKQGSGPKTKDPMPKLNVKEDVEAMFVGEDLSETFMENASTLFEAAVSARVIAETARLEEEFETKLQEEITSISEEITSKLDSYLEYVTEKWMEENEVAINSSLQTEITNEFINGLKNLFIEHYIEIPSDKVDVIEKLAEEVSSLEEKLDEAITENYQLKNILSEATKESIFSEISADLALTQQEKFAALAEGIEFDGDLEVYEKKLKIIKENYFKQTSPEYTTNLHEEVFESNLNENTVTVDPSVNRYVQAISKTIKK